MKRLDLRSGNFPATWGIPAFDLEYQKGELLRRRERLRRVLAPGETVLLYTDGLIEAREPSDQEYGDRRAAQGLATHAGDAPKDLVGAFREDLTSFRGSAPHAADLTLMAIRRR